MTELYDAVLNPLCYNWYHCGPTLGSMVSCFLHVVSLAQITRFQPPPELIRAPGPGDHRLLAAERYPLAVRRYPLAARRYPSAAERGRACVVPPEPAS